MTANAGDKTRTQVLVVGAGPVGLLAALRLRVLGVDVRIIDQQSQHRMQTFPVVLHPQSVRLLNELGVAAALHWRGRAITQLAIYTEHQRRAVLDLPNVVGVARGALTLPQDILRQALTNTLLEQGVEVEWNTRLAVLQQDRGSVWGRLVQHEPIASRVRPEVQAFDAEFVIGADGYESSVREALGIELLQCSGMESYAFFDASSPRSGSEAQLALSEEFANAVYPIQGGLTRFSFQLASSLHRPPDSESLRELVEARIPWYADQPERCEWSGIAEFRRALVQRFGEGRVWLAGEAAHLNGPLGVQSLNVGLDEGNELGQHIARDLHHPSSEPFGQAYEAGRQRQWRALLGLDPAATMSARTPTWVRRHLRQLLPCLPASGGDLDDLLEQLRLAQSVAPSP